MMACNSEDDIYRICPPEGQGELTEEFLTELGRQLDNEKQFQGSWREFGTLLLNCRTIELDDIWRRSEAPLGKQSPTWIIYRTYTKNKGTDIVDARALWDFFYNVMGRKDVANILENWHRDDKLFRQDQSHKFDILARPHPSFDHNHSFATYPPEEGSDISSIVNQEKCSCHSVAKVGTLTVIANNVEIKHSSRDRYSSTETASLHSTSSGSTSSLPREMDITDQPSRVNLPNSIPVVRHDDPSRNLGIVLITYAMHDAPKAVDLGLHLNFHGFEVILDNPASLSEQERKRKCKSIFKKASAVVVVYSSYYRQEILAKPKQNKRNTRYIYSLMKEEHEKKGGNLRSVFYPMYKVQTGNKIPRIFNNLPQHQPAQDVHGLLFRQVQQPGSA